MKEQISIEEINILLNNFIEKLAESNKKIIEELQNRHQLEIAMKYLTNVLPYNSITANKTEILI